MRIKKIIKLFVCMAMIMMCTSTVFAEISQDNLPQSRQLVLNKYTGIWLGYGPTNHQCVNVYGNETISPGRNVISWDCEGTMAQQWMLKNLGNGNYIVSSRLRDAYGREYVLNRNTYNYKCIVWPLDTAVTVDTVIVDPGPVLTQVIELKYADAAHKYLSPDAIQRGASISWGATPFQNQ